MLLFSNNIFSFYIESITRYNTKETLVFDINNFASMLINLIKQNKLYNT